VGIIAGTVLRKLSLVTFCVVGSTTVAKLLESRSGAESRKGFPAAFGIRASIREGARGNIALERVVRIFYLPSLVDLAVHHPLYSNF
jgi:hypothetical protein